MTKKVSVIVPVYNIEQYLATCLDSILAQSYTDFELILVDDGSTDKSPEICDLYSNLDSRVKTFHKTNGGVSSARNFGIEASEGEWIAFVDGDDYIVPEYLESLVSAIQSQEVGMVSCNLLFLNLDGSTTKHPFFRIETYSTDTIRNKFFSDETVKTQFYGPYNKIIKRSIIGNIRFQDFALGEDILFIFELLGRMSYITVIPLIGYQYIKRHSSATTAKFSIKRLEYVNAAHAIINIARTYSEYVLLEAQIWTIRHSIVTLRRIFNARIEDKCRDFIKEELNFIKTNKHLLTRLSIKRRLDYIILSHIPKLFRFLFI